MLHAALHVLRPVAHVLVRIEDQIGGTGHVVLAFTLAHVVHLAVRFVGMVADVAVLLVAGDLVS